MKCVHKLFTIYLLIFTCHYDIIITVRTKNLLVHWKLNITHLKKAPHTTNTMEYRDNRYFPNGAIIGRSFYSDIKDYASYMFKGYYRDTELLTITISFDIDENGEYIPDISIWIDTVNDYGQSTNSYYLRKLCDTIRDMYNYDFGDLFINTTNHIFKGIVEELYNIYKHNRNNMECEYHSIKVFNKIYNAEIYIY